VNAGTSTESAFRSGKVAGADIRCQQRNVDLQHHREHNHSSQRRRKKVSRKKHKSAGKAELPSVAFRSFNYRCSFCLNVMKPAPLMGLGYLLVLLGLRRQYCPHCFSAHLLPYGWLRYALFPFRYVYISLNEEDDD